MISVCFPSNQAPAEKESLLEEKSLLPLRAHPFHFRVDPFSEGCLNNVLRVAFLKLFTFLWDLVSKNTVSESTVSLLWFADKEKIFWLPESDV